MKYEKVYQKLKERLTDEEIADSMLVPADLTSGKKEKLANEMREIRMQKLKEATEEDYILASVMQLRCNIERYIKDEKFSHNKTFRRIYLQNKKK